MMRRSLHFLIYMRGRAGYIYKYTKDLGINNNEVVYPSFYLRHKFLAHTTYSYRTETGGLTFTGVGKGFTMGGLQDSLMEEHDPKY